MTKKKNKLLRMLLSFVLLAGSLSVPVKAQESIVPGNVDYEVHMKDAKRVFIGNDKAIKYEVGRKYFLHYTVEDIQSNTTTQSGMIISKDKTEAYPYSKGGLQYDVQSVLLEEGYTYFLRFEITKDGLNCIAARSKVKGEDSNYIRLPHTFGDIKTKGQYFGAWFAETGSVTGTLSHVRCYDENGTDLGVYGDQTAGVVVLKEGDMEENEKVAHSYAFSLKDAGCVAISNGRFTDAKEVYLEYTVKNVRKKEITQSGVILTNSPMAVYPHGDGSGELVYTPHEKTEECDLLDEGATYLYRFNKQANQYTVLVKRTCKGKTDYFSFPHKFGTFNAKNGYYSVWIGENCSVSAEFTDVKCYDEEGNNLAIQTNQGVDITHYGDLEDYSQCAAVYYCKAKNTMLTLDDDCHASYQVQDSSVTTPGTYSIRDGILTLKTKSSTEKYEYVYSALTDKEGNRYDRLKDVTVTYVSDKIGGQVLENVTVTAKDGYRLRMPANPTADGRVFKEWQRGDGTAYKFDEVVTESLALYATWDGEQKFTAATLLGAVKDNGPAIAIAVSLVLLIGTALGLGLTGRRKRHDKG